MEMEKIQLLRDVDEFPSEKVIADGLGRAYDVYTQFVDGLENFDISLMDWRFYNDGKSWLTKGEYKWVTSRGTNKVKPLFWLSIWQGFFKVAFFFSEKIRDELLSLPISEESKEIINSAKPIGKTRKFTPIIFDISDSEQLADIYTLAKFRKENI